ncbi:MAG: hypothetical protein ACO35C_03860 [Pontimonas sp.]
MKKRPLRLTSRRLIRPALDPREDAPWPDESSDDDPSYEPRDALSGSSSSTTLTVSEHSHVSEDSTESESTESDDR